MNDSARSRRVTVSADGRGLVSHPAVGDAAGHRPGPGAVAGLEQWRTPREVHDPGKIVADLAAALPGHEEPSQVHQTCPWRGCPDA
jgi:hypothetical protein